MDELDHQIVGLLRRDARLPIASIAAVTDVARATVKTRINKLVESGVIEKFTINLGAATRNSNVRAIVQIEVLGKNADNVAQELLRLPEIRALHSTNGRWDFVAELESKDLVNFDEALREIRLIDGISLTESNILLSSKYPPAF